MHAREATHHAILMNGMRSLTVAAAACLAFVSAVHAGEPKDASADIVTGTPLWRYALLSPLHSTTSGDLAKGEVPVTLGRTSPSVKQLAARVLGERYPCSAMALTFFEPPASRDSRWEFPLRGAPTTATVVLIANGAQDQQIDESIRTLGSMPYDPYRPLGVSVTITTRPLAADVSISTIRCNIIDSGNGVSLQTLEPAIEFVWRPDGARLLGVYAET